jgi:type VI protein secretion system component VasF
MEDGNEFNKGQLTQQVTDHERRLEKNDKEHSKMWETLDRVRNRLPVWATLLIGCLLAIIGFLAKSIIGS